MNDAQTFSPAPTVSRRKRGQGRVYRQKTSRFWWVKYYVGGRAVCESTRTTNRREAEAFLKRRLAEATLGITPASNVRLEALLDALVGSYETEGRGSLPQLRSRLTHLLPALGRVKAAELTSDQVEAYKRRRRAEGAAAATVNRELEHLRAALRLALDDGKIRRVPKVRMFREQNTREGFLDEGRYRALRDVLRAEYPYLWPLMVVAYHTGARKGELLALGWGQVDWERGQIELAEGQTKDGAARTLPIYGEMGEALRAAFAERRTYFPECAWVFQRGGRRIVDFRKAWAAACALAGCEGLQFHDLRRSAVMMMDRAGIPHDVSRRITGHKTDAMRRRYRIVPAQEIAAAGKTAEAYLERERAKREAAEEGEVVQ